MEISVYMHTIGLIPELLSPWLLKFTDFCLCGSSVALWST